MKTVNPVYAARRAKLAETMHANGGGVAVLFAGTEVMRNRDSDYPFRWDSYFYYLTGFPEPESAVVVIADANGTHRSLLFCREKNEERETWDGFRHGPEAAIERFGFDAAFPIGGIDTVLSSELKNRQGLWYPLGESETTDQRVRAWLASVRAQGRSGVTAPAQANDVHSVLDDMRLVKDDHELNIMRRAADISANAHVRAMQATHAGLHEFEIEAELLHEFRRNGSQFPAYGSIVAGGANACVLHYRSNDSVLRNGELLLIDAGCELDGYASDITRSFPVSGHFTDGQRELYDIVLAAQQAAIAATCVGATFNDPHDAALRVLVQGMIDTGLINETLDGAIESGSYRRFYMHRTSHWLGMDVHDCGDYRERTAGDSTASDPPRDKRAGGQSATPAQPGGKVEPPWRILRAGMVLTIEPGIYVRAGADVPERFHNVGIRIEDDAVVTAGGCDIITGGVPKQADEIERLMKPR